MKLIIFFLSVFCASIASADDVPVYKYNNGLVYVDGESNYIKKVLAIPAHITNSRECIDYKNSSCKMSKDLLNYFKKSDKKNGVLKNILDDNYIPQRYSSCKLQSDSCATSRIKMCNLISGTLPHKDGSELSYEEKSRVQLWLKGYFVRIFKDLGKDKVRYIEMIKDISNSNKCLAIAVAHSSDSRFLVCNDPTDDTNCETKVLNVFETMVFSGSFSKMGTLIREMGKKADDEKDVVRAMFGSKERALNFFKHYYHRSKSTNCRDFIAPYISHKGKQKCNGSGEIVNDESNACAIIGCNNSLNIIKRFLNRFIYEAYPSMKPILSNESEYQW